MEIIYEEGLEPSKYTKDIIDCVEKTLRPNSVRGSHKDIVAHITGANDIRTKVPSYTELCKECKDVRKKERVKVVLHFSSYL